MAGLNLPNWKTSLRLRGWRRRKGGAAKLPPKCTATFRGGCKLGMRVFALAKIEAARRELKIEDAWPHKTYVVLKFAGVDSISDAEPLVG